MSELLYSCNYCLNKIVHPNYYFIFFSINLLLSHLINVSVYCFTQLIQIYYFLTGIKFVVITDPRQGEQDQFLKKLYEIYADFALKNPFYSLDMPIR